MKTFNTFNLTNCRHCKISISLWLEISDNVHLPRSLQYTLTIMPRMQFFFSRQNLLKPSFIINLITCMLWTCVIYQYIWMWIDGIVWFIEGRGIIVSVLASSVADRGFEPWSNQTKDYKIGICCFSTKHAVLRRKSKDWLVWNQDNVFEWDDCCFSELAL
jgi:hypothetical protein